MALNETYFRYLADEGLGKDWQRLATHLDFKKAEIDRFKADNQSNMANQIFDMLIAWSQKQASLGDAAAEILINALEKAGQVGLAEELRERMPSAGQAAGASEETDAGVHITSDIFIGSQPKKVAASQQKPQASKRYTYESKPGTGGIHIDEVTITATNSPVIMGAMNNCTMNFNTKD